MKLKVFEADYQPQGNWTPKRLKALVDSDKLFEGLHAACLIEHNCLYNVETELFYGWEENIYLCKKELCSEIKVLSQLAKHLREKQLSYVSLGLVSGNEENPREEPSQLLRLAFSSHSIPQVKTTRRETFTDGKKKGDCHLFAKSIRAEKPILSRQRTATKRRRKNV